MEKFPLKHVHLDFHTSPDIDGIGKNFSKENFQEGLKKAHLDSITVFAKCHHSLCYYPTKIGTMHPNLNFDLTGAMIDAAHEIGVKAPVYITAGWSHNDAINHPEWISINKDGEYQSCGIYEKDADCNQPKKTYVWHELCLNDGDYAEHIYALTEEVCERYKGLDGLFFDICFNGSPCYCDTCKKGMKDMGLNPENEDDAKKYFILKRQVFMKKCTDILKKHHKDATIFFNGGAELQTPYYHDFQSHFEMEDLPTAGGGYDKLPLRAKFFAEKNKPIIGMTGKFHLSWGEFGGFKTKDALKYEIATMALYGAGASIGDHLHPDGEMEMATYENIGYAYSYLDKIAPFCYGGKPVVNLGLYISDNFSSNEGISKILLENHIDYEIVSGNDFEKFDTVIFSEGAELYDEGIEKLNSYIKNGGHVLLMADALVKDGKFLIDTGLKYIGNAEFDCDYIVSNGNFDNVPDAPVLTYIPGHITENIDGEIFAEIILPYFNRTYGHFCGHKNTPYNKESKRLPAITRKGNVVYIAHPYPRQFNDVGCVFHKKYFMNALNLIYSGSPLKVSGFGPQGRCSMISQPEFNRYCINLTCANPIKRGWAEIIDDILPVYNIKVSVKTEKIIETVYFGLTGEKIEFTQEKGEVNFTIPEFTCHTSIVIKWSNL